MRLVGSVEQVYHSLGSLPEKTKEESSEEPSWGQKKPERLVSGLGVWLSGRALIKYAIPATHTVLPQKLPFTEA
jgi:hypothetical protein